MNLKQMEVFLTVADTGSFSRAAEMSFITQSTVSQHISALEKEFGVRLLDRTGHGAVPTEGGKLLLGHVRSIVAAVREAEKAISRFAGMEEAVLAIGGSNIPGIHMIPQALAAFLVRQPGVRSTVVQADSGEILNRLAREDVEVAVVGSRPDDDRFESFPLRDDEILVFVSGDHRWSSREEITLEDLESEPMILRETGSGTGRAVMETLARHGFLPRRFNVKMTLGSSEAVRNAVLAGAGAAFLSELSAAPESLHALRIAGVPIFRTFYACRRRGRDLSPAAAEFMSLLLKMYGPEKE